MYKPIFDSQKQSLIRNVLALAERINAETPFVVGYTLDQDQTVLNLSVKKKKTMYRTFEIQLEPATPHTNYTEDREFKDERQDQMRKAAAYLQAVFNAEQTRDQHEQLDRFCNAHKKDIESLAISLTSRGEYAATVTYTGDDFLTLSIRSEGSSLFEPLLQLVVVLTPQISDTDAETLAFKEKRNAQLSEIIKFVTDLVNAT